MVVNVYTTLTGAREVQVNNSLILLVPELPGWLIPLVAARNHENEHPEVALVGIQVNVLPLHIGAGVKGQFKIGIGFTGRVIV